MADTPRNTLAQLGLTAAASSFLNTIKGKIFIVFAVTFISVCALMAINLASLVTVKERLLQSERYDDLLNDFLEMRRYEKNYLFPTTPTPCARAWLPGLTEALVDELADDIVRIAGARTLVDLRDTMGDYEQSLRAFETGNAAALAESRIRTQGKALLDSAEALRKTKRAHIHATLVHTLWLPFAFLAVFLLLMVLVIRLINTRLLRPLHMVRATTRRVARGDFRPIPEGPDRHIGEISGLISAFNRMSEELETNQEDLLQARKIAALGTFTAGIAHELNNPINNILLTAEALLEGWPQKPEGEEDEDGEMMREIMAQAERAGDIVRNLLSFSRTETTAVEALAPEQVVQSTLSLIRNQIMLGNLQMDVDVAPGLPEIIGNLRGLQQVFMNLLLNAIQATEPGGRLSIRAADDPRAGCCSRSRTRARASRPRSWSTSSSPSTPPRTWAAARAWACPWPTPSSSAAAGTSTWTATPARARSFPCACPRPGAGARDDTRSEHHAHSHSGR